MKLDEQHWAEYHFAMIMVRSIALVPEMTDREMAGKVALAHCETAKSGLEYLANTYGTKPRVSGFVLTGIEEDA